MTSMWRSMVVGLAFALALQAQGQIVTDGVRDGVLDVLLGSNALLHEEGDFEGARALLEALDPSSLRPVELAQVRMRVAATYLSSGQLERAKTHYRMVIDESANLPPELLDPVYNNLAGISLQLKDYEDTLRIVRTWRDRVEQPRPHAHKLLAYAHFFLGNHAAAVAEGELYVEALRTVGEAVPPSFERFLAQARRPEGEVSDPRNE